MAMTKCKECGGDLSTKAEACPKCGAKVPHTSVAAMGCLTIVVIFVVLAAIGAIFGDGSPSGNSPMKPSAGPGSHVVEPGPSATDRSSGTTASSSLTAAQRNAVRTANSYLKLKGFSRQGLIDQLSSEYGDRFSVADATVAVDSLDIDWNTQAGRAAASYLKLKGFSCQGLIDQLSSQYGDKYTVQQATYGANHAGAC